MADVRTVRTMDSPLRPGERIRLEAQHSDGKGDLSMERARSSVSVLLFVGMEGPDRSSWTPVVLIDDDGFMVRNDWDGTWRLPSNVGLLANVPAGDYKDLVHVVCASLLLRSLDGDKARLRALFAESVKLPAWREIVDEMTAAQLSAAVLET